MANHEPRSRNTPSRSEGTRLAVVLSLSLNLFLAAVLSAILIFLSAYEIASITFHPSPSSLRNLDRTMVVPADAANWRTDLAPLAVVAAGIAGARFSFAFADRIAAFLVLILVVRAGYGILEDSMKSLLDASVDYRTPDRMREVVKRFPLSPSGIKGYPMEKSCPAKFC